MSDSPDRRGPLARFKVIDLTRVRSGPTAVRQFADWGADVIRIESPPALHISDGWGGPRDGPDFQNLQRNKRSLTLNFKDPDGLAIFRKLADRADVGGDGGAGGEADIARRPVARDQDHRTMFHAGREREATGHGDDGSREIDRDGKRDRRL